MSQKISEMTLENDNVTREASPCKRPGPDSTHDGPILKKASGSKKVLEIQTPKSVSENTRDTEADESAIRENKYRQEKECFERQLIFERQQNVDLVVNKKETVWTYLELKYIEGGLDEEPALDNGSALELALKFAESDTDSDEDDDETSMKSFGVDIEDMTSYEFSTYSELQKVLGRLNNKNSEDDEEEKEQGFLADRLIYCLQNVRNVPSPKHDRSLARAVDLVRTFDRAELGLVSNPKKAPEKFSLGEILKVKNSLKEIMDEFTQKFYYYTKVKASAINARDKMGEPKVTSSMDKFAQYVDFLEKDIEAFWRNNECVSIVAETGRALNVVKRVEKAVRECSKDKEGKA
ncbi:hypothetical protein OXX69_000806 [Metschnikowia pulcherrima]